MQSYIDSVWRGNRTGTAAPVLSGRVPAFHIHAPPFSTPTLYCIYRSSYTLTIFDKTPQPGKPSDARSMLFYVCFLPESYTQGTKKIICPSKTCNKQRRIFHKAAPILFDKKLHYQKLPLSKIQKVSQRTKKRNNIAEKMIIILLNIQ